MQAHAIGSHASAVPTPSPHTPVNAVQKLAHAIAVSGFARAGGAEDDLAEHWHRPHLDLGAEGRRESRLPTHLCAASRHPLPATPLCLHPHQCVHQTACVWRVRRPALQRRMSRVAAPRPLTWASVLSENETVVITVLGDGAHRLCPLSPTPFRCRVGGCAALLCVCVCVLICCAQPAQERRPSSASSPQSCLWKKRSVLPAVCCVCVCVNDNAMVLLLVS